MAKKNRRKQKGMGFAIFMVVYALVFLTATGFGLRWFWGYMDAYEASRPHIAIDKYMANLSKDRIVSSCDVILEKADLNIQSEEECRGFLMDTISGEITYARKASACTDTRQTYVLRSGNRVIGSFTIEATEPDEYGFTPWVFREEQFDLSDLMGTETVSVTVPEGYGVYVNGVKLDEGYIIDTETRRYEAFEELYGIYEVPELVLCTYEAGPFLNAQYQMEVYDPNGKPFTMDENFDENDLINITDSTLLEDLDAFLEEYVEVYVIFAGCANDDRIANYKRMMEYVVADSTFAQRMADALDGMQFAQSMGDEVDTIRVNQYTTLSEGRYMCDVTYLVNTTGREGVVQTTNNVKIIIVRSGSKLLVESMISY